MRSWCAPMIMPRPRRWPRLPECRLSNGLTDASHPCQIVADLLTIVERGKALPGLQLAWLGDCNNVLNSLIEAAGLFKFAVHIGTPVGYKPNPDYVARARARGGQVFVVADAAQAVADADVVVTDTWISMGQSHAKAKIAELTPFQVDSRLMREAKPDAVFLHCLPAHLGEEVTEEIFEGPQSAVFDEAENRIHAQKAILLWALGQLPR